MMTEEKLKEITKQFHEEVIKTSRETIIELQRKKEEVDKTIAKLDERIKRSLIIIERL